ncbi:MAG: preprotein translocase subunit SecG [Gammaproteobacteria bacterium]|nr:preprotein translocase subunit SecG [Gammaproteobacteria bacterium]
MIINILIVVHVVVAVSIIALVLLQQGRGADMGAAFGGGSQTLFGARGSANFLSRLTGILVAVFFFTSMSLAYIYTQRSEPQSVTEEVQTQPAAPAPDTTVPDPSPGQAAGSENGVPEVPGAGSAGTEPQAPSPGPGDSSPIPAAPK